MSDELNHEATEAEAAEAPVIEVTQQERVFKVGGTTIHEDDTTAGLTNEDARNVLKAAFPEVANATIRQTEKDGVVTVEFLPQPGRKG